MTAAAGPQTALVAMSGGVDSSVAAALMLERGHEVIGVTLKQWEGPEGEMPTAGCCTVADAEDARRAAAVLGIPYYVLDYVDEFKQKVVSQFGAEYMAGRTPNPCIECNRKVRFNVLVDRAKELGCDVLVTGHHARVAHEGDRHRLLKGKDASKDQSYVLHMLRQEQLSRVELPIGELTKPEVRTKAASLGLRVADKPDSQDICFVGKGDYRTFLRTHFPEAARPGPIVTTEGEVIGDHEGTVDFTIGQRKGLGIAVGEPRYVVGIEPDRATVVVGTKDELLVAGCEVTDVSLVDDRNQLPDMVDVKVRYRATPVQAKVVSTDFGWQIMFDRPQHGIAPGQAAVLYDGDQVLGGGTITTAIA